MGMETVAKWFAQTISQGTFFVTAYQPKGVSQERSIRKERVIMATTWSLSRDAASEAARVADEVKSSATTLPEAVGFPYGFPTPGAYRILVQMKHGGSVETGAFDACAGPIPGH
jgi:hypothetical protein